MHDDKSFIIKKITVDDDTTEHEFWCYCKGCGVKGTKKRGFLRVAVTPDGVSYGFNWWNFQHHVFLCDSDLWYRIWYVYIQK